jgi:hypothetical protein
MSTPVHKEPTGKTFRKAFLNKERGTSQDNDVDSLLFPAFQIP